MLIRRIGVVSRTYRHVNRYRQILTVLIKYGFGGLIDRLNIGQYLEIGWQLISRQHRGEHEHIETLTTPERIRMSLEELGPTFIKLGQMLSTRPDLIPAELADELAKLQQHVPPFPVAEARQIIAAELGRPPEELYAHFEAESLAAASIGQVHRATLHDGEEVVVKIQRPNIRATIEVDLEILLHLAHLAEKHLEDWRVQRPSRAVEEFGRVLAQELDYTTEARNLERFAHQFSNDETVYVPKVYRDMTSTRVLTLEYVDVIPVSDRDSLVRAGLDPVELARRGTELTLKQIFVHGFFHADPHPGNVFALPGNIICPLDFGMMGRLDRHVREAFADLVHAIADRNETAATGALLRLTDRDEDDGPDYRRLERDFSEFIDVNVVVSLRDLDFGRLMHGLLDLVRRHRLRIPPDIVTMIKAAVTAERTAVQLAPDLNMVAAAEPYVRKLKMDRLRPRRVMRELLNSGGEVLQLAREIPGGVRDLLRQAKRGGLRIAFEHRGLENLIKTNEGIANRLAFAIIVAALIVGSSVIVHSKLPPLWYGIPIIGLVGFLAAGVTGFMLLISIIRHGRL